MVHFPAATPDGDEPSSGGLTPEEGRYKNAKNGAEFDLALDGDEAVLSLRGREICRRDAIQFGFNVEIGTYELIETASGA